MGTAVTDHCIRCAERIRGMSEGNTMNKKEIYDNIVLKAMQTVTECPKKGILDTLLSRFDRAHRGIWGYRVFNEETTRGLVVKYLETVKDEIEVSCLAKHLDIYWLRVKQVLYTQHLTSAGVRRKSLINGWTPVWRDFHIYFKRT